MKEMKINVSGFSYYCISFLIVSIFWNFYRDIIWIMYLILIILTISKFVKKQNFLLIHIGIITSIVFLHIETIGRKSFIDQYIPIAVFEDVRTKKTKFTFQIDKEIKRNFYLITITIDNVSYKTYLNTYEKYLSIGKYSCESDSLKKVDIKEFNEYLHFIPNDNPYFFKWNKKKCIPDESIVIYSAKIRAYISSLIDKGKIGKEPEGVVKAFLFGDSSFLSKEFKESAKEGGILHLFAASGLHMGIFVGFIFIVLKRIPFLNYYIVHFLTIIISFFYLFLLNFPISLSRAYLFSIILIFAKVLFRKLNSFNLLVYSLFIVRILLSNDFLGLSFNLSYGAIIGIFFLYPMIKNLFFGQKNNFLIENFSVSFSASLSTLPILLYYFHGYSLGSIAINVILIPYTSFLLPILYLSLLIQFLSLPYLKEIFWILSEILIRLLLKLSIVLSESISFYKEYKIAKNEIFLFYGFLMLILLILYIVKYLINKRSNVNLKVIPFTILSWSLYLGFSYFMFIKADPIVIETSTKKYAGIDMYVYKNQRNLFLGGSCKYNHSILFKIFQNQDCKFIQEIHISDISCIEFALKCNENIRYYYQGSIKEIDFLNLFSEVKLIKEKFPKSFLEDEGFIVFKPGLDSIGELSLLTKKGNGIILLQLPYKSKDTSKDWNINKKYLGISDSWNFLTPMEMVQ